MEEKNPYLVPQWFVSLALKSPNGERSIKYKLPITVPLNFCLK